MVAEYIDEDEGFRKEKEKQIVEEGRLGIFCKYDLYFWTFPKEHFGISRNKRNEIFCSEMLTS